MRKIKPKHDGFAARTVEVTARRGWKREDLVGHEVTAELTIQTVPYPSVDQSKFGRGTIWFSIERFPNSTFSITGKEKFNCEVNRPEIDSLIEALEAIRDIGDEGDVWAPPTLGGTTGGIGRKSRRRFSA